MERLVLENGKALAVVSREEMERLWDTVKGDEPKAAASTLEAGKAR